MTTFKRHVVFGDYISTYNEFKNGLRDKGIKFKDIKIIKNNNYWEITLIK